jgi:hypothetical protein
MSNCRIKNVVMIATSYLQKSITLPAGKVWQRDALRFSLVAIVKLKDLTPGFSPPSHQHCSFATTGKKKTTQQGADNVSGGTGALLILLLCHRPNSVLAVPYLICTAVALGNCSSIALSGE